MTSQLSRQLELNVNALSRGFRQALRHATKTDPLGTPETSPAWKTVVARQELLLHMLRAVAPFLLPAAPAETAPVESISAFEDISAKSESPIQPDALENADDTDDHIDDEQLSEEEFRANLPPEVRRVHEKIDAVMKWPTDTPRQKRHRSQELQRLKGALMRRLEAWRAEIIAQAEAHGLPIPQALLEIAPT